MGYFLGEGRACIPLSRRPQLLQSWVIFQMPFDISLLAQQHHALLLEERTDLLCLLRVYLIFSHSKALGKTS